MKQQKLRKFKKLSDPTTKAYTQQSWKIWKKMDEFLYRYLVLKLNQDKINNLNDPITPKEMEAVIKSLPTKKAQDQMGSVQNFIRHLSGI